MPTKRFSLKRNELSFSERQKMFIEHHIELHEHWKGLKDLVSIKFISIDNNSFTVEVEETDIKWHTNFSKKLCQLASLDNLCLNTTNDRYLFDVKTID